MSRILKPVVVLLVLSCATSAFAWHPDPAPGLLLLWPTARSTALAGAMTALADEADAAYYNPAGFGFQTRAKAVLNYCHWLPGLYPGMRLAYGSFGLPLGPVLTENLNLGLNVAYISLGEIDVINELGEFLGRYTVWRGAAGIHAGVKVSDKLGLGLNLKLIHSQHTADYFWWPPQPHPELGLDQTGTGTGVGADVGLLYHPFDRVSIGLTLANIGPDVFYSGHYSYPPDSLWPAPLPWTLRLGLCWTPLDNDRFRLRVLPELDKVLVGMFYDPDSTETLSEKLQTEFNDAWKTLGAEFSAFNIVHLRLAYFEDLVRDRGGVRVKRDGRPDHISLLEFLFTRDPGSFERIGLCWGFGIGYKDYVRLDVSSDAAIYDFPTSNWKFSLTANDIPAAIRAIRQ